MSFDITYPNYTTKMYNSITYLISGIIYNKLVYEYNTLLNLYNNINTTNNIYKHYEFVNDNNYVDEIEYKKLNLLIDKLNIEFKLLDLEK